LDAVLEQHELVKVKVIGEDRDARDAMIADLADRTEAALVQRIGHTAVLYRPSKERRHIVLPRG
ncbi:MAG: ribosome assembly RNA-binding protein YhbY, partial [Xanthomonas sp.]|nr:ribosome assembly RNA-binding protein YhbY [Xanthomonas sp.]